MITPPKLAKPRPDVDFRYKVEGLEASFQYLSTEFPEDIQILWEFGDKSTSKELDPIHVYSKIGQYRVTLSVKNSKGEFLGRMMKFVSVSDFIKTHLSASIYDLIDTYIPEDIFGEVSRDKKIQFIEKWQLYLQPLVNHFIPIDKFNDELYYEALENQLIVELAAYDYDMLMINLTLQSLAREVRENTEVTDESTSETDSETGANDKPAGKVKRIITGPTEVEYFNSSGSSSETVSALNSALKPGGFIDTLLKNICMLAERLDIYLPLCSRLPLDKVPPKNVNKRSPGFLKGPDPVEIIQ